MRRLCNKFTLRISCRWISACPTPSSTLSSVRSSPSDLLDGVTIVKTAEQAKAVVEQLGHIPGYHACDTEVADIDLKRQSPVGQGNVTCISIYCGPEHNFGGGPVVWADTMDKAVLEEFRPYFESENVLKVWHNYSFDRHVLFNHGIDCKGLGADTLHMARMLDSSLESYSLEKLSNRFIPSKEAKVSMKDRFQTFKLKKDGSESSLKVLPGVIELQTSPEYCEEWIQYSAEDARITWDLFQVLKGQLTEQTLQIDGKSCSMMDLYEKYWRPFGVLLTDMEREGIFVDVEHLKAIEKKALEEAEQHRLGFLEWASRQCADAKFMNVTSSSQKQQLLFADPKQKKHGLEPTRVFSCENIDGYIEPGKKNPTKTRPFVLRGMGFPVQRKSASNKLPSADSVSIRALAGNPSKNEYGLALSHFKSEAEGKEACEALDSLLEHSAIQTLVSTFILPLQQCVDDQSRIHCSLNINTETGRLSARRPNLQNQPALEKDKYKIRKAFAAAPGKALIVADYSQLELRVLAELSNCKAMIEAFESGEDLHSRTAISMFDHVKAAVDRGEVIVEADDNKPEVKLLKEVFANERKKAKGLNFSIAYGKTSYGLAKEWNISAEEAQDLLKKWYAGRPEVEKLQKDLKQFARYHKYVPTILGRRRALPMINSKNMRERSHSERCAINSPIQGSAADLMMAAMLKLASNKRLVELGWKLVLQIHDEVIMEGPLESSQEAFSITKEIMENPLERPLRCPIEISGGVVTNWFEGK